MKKRKCISVTKYFLITAAFCVCGCRTISDNSVTEYPYHSAAESIDANIKNDDIQSLSKGYMNALREYNKNNSAENAQLLASIPERMNNLLKNYTENKNYEQAVDIADTLVNLGIDTDIPYEDCYRNYLAALEASDDVDNFTIESIKNRMGDKKLLSENEVATLLDGYFKQNSIGLFSYYLNHYKEKYLTLTAKFPDLEKKFGILLDNVTAPDFETLMKSVVTVILDKGIVVKNGVGGQDKSLGTGFFIDGNGYILTNHHVIAEHVDPGYKGYTSVRVSLRDNPDVEYSAKVVGWDKIYDVALLKLLGHKNENFMIPGISGSMKIGDKIFTIGNPLGIRYTVTSGIISNREIDIFQMGQGFQVDAAINPGNSGGPLIDERGQVVGIVFAGIPQYAGISFAIPFEWVRQTIPLLYRGGEVKRSWMGAGLYHDYERGNLQFYYLMPGGGADEAGILPGDILVSINGRKISGMAEAQSLTAWEKSGGIIRVGINRNGQNMELPVRLDVRPQIPVEQIFKKDSYTNIIKLIAGMKVEQTRKRLGTRYYKIDYVYKGMPAYSLNVSEGDPLVVYGMKYLSKEKAVILSINYTNREISMMQRSVTLALPAEINNLL